MDFRLELPNLRFRKCLVHCGTSNAVKFMLFCTKRGVYQGAGGGIEKMLMLVSYAARAGINLVQILRVAAVKLLWVDSYNGT